MKAVDDYIAAFPEPARKMLARMRRTIRKAAPKAEEVISYRMPAYRQDGILVWFAGHARHIGFYPRASGIAAFKAQLSKYKSAKGSVQFPLDEPLPVALIAKIVRYRVKENAAKRTPKHPSEGPR